VPELDDTHTIARLERRIAELEAGDEIAKRDLYAVLDERQQRDLESELAAQKLLKKKSKARTDEDKEAAGWKTIREVRIEALKRALLQAEANDPGAWQQKEYVAEVRRARIYMDSFVEAMAAGRTAQVAHTWANNELTRAGLSRMDGPVVGATSARDKSVNALEEAILKRARSEMTPYDLGQLELLEEHMKTDADRSGSGRKGHSD
jgi:hypothetical protein